MRLPAADALRDALGRQWGELDRAVAGLAPEAFREPTRLPGWTVAELVAHVSTSTGNVARVLAEPEPARADTDAAGYYAGAADLAGDVAERAAALAAEARPAELRVMLARAVQDAEAALAAASPQRLVGTRLGALPLDAYLATRCVEATVHALDLAAATGAQLPLDDVAVSAAARVLAAVLVAQAPGRAVELRIPGPGGFAVQCVAGPRHTRGTPGSVVEADPESWLELAGGRLGWAEAVRAGRVRASGEHSDLSGWLPVLR